MVKPVMFSTKRLRVRALEDNDLGMFLKLINDPLIRIAAFLDTGSPISEKMCQGLFSEWTVGTENHKTDYWFGIDSFENGEVLGVAGLYQIDFINGRALGPLVMLDPVVQGKGLGAEAMALVIDFAFGNLRLHRLYSEVNVFNEKQIRLREKMGYKKEGIQRDANYLKGRYYDIVTFGMLADEWWAVREKFLS